MSSERNPLWYDSEDPDEPMGSLRLGICVGLVWLANLIFLPAKLYSMVEGGVVSAFRDVEPVRRSADTEPLKGGTNGPMVG